MGDSGQTRKAGVFWGISLWGSVSNLVHYDSEQVFLYEENLQFYTVPIYTARGRAKVNKAELTLSELIPSHWRPQ